MKSIKKQTKKAFLTVGSCSTTYFHILNKQFGNSDIKKEKAAEPLAGGILREGCQCGMLWGASLAIGTESCKKNEDQKKAIAQSIHATKNIVESFKKCTNTVDCFDLTNINLKKKLAVIKLILFKARGCFKLAGKWSEDAVKVAKDGLNGVELEYDENTKSCATILLEKMGASKEEAITVAGLAGGMGLSGNGCGALAAAIWYNTLKWSLDNPGKDTYNNIVAQKTLEAFYIETNGEVLCKEISGKQFKNLKEHSEFLENGGCSKILEVLEATKYKSADN